MCGKHKPYIQRLETYIDERGSLVELVHSYDLPHDEFYGLIPFPNLDDTPTRVARFGQVYVVQNPQAGTIRAFHRHEKLWDYFTIVTGSAKFWVVPLDQEEGKPLMFVLSSQPQSRLIVPPGWWHGWESLEPNTTLVCTGTEVYDRQNPDEVRIGFEEFYDLGVYWGVQPK